MELPPSAVRRTTVDGYPYVAIEPAGCLSPLGPGAESQYPVYPRDGSGNVDVPLPFLEDAACLRFLDDEDVARQPRCIDSMAAPCPKSHACVYRSKRGFVYTAAHRERYLKARQAWLEHEQQQLSERQQRQQQEQELQQRSNNNRSLRPLRAFPRRPQFPPIPGRCPPSPFATCCSTQSLRAATAATGRRRLDLAPPPPSRRQGRRVRPPRRLLARRRRREEAAAAAAANRQMRLDRRRTKVQELKAISALARVTDPSSPTATATAHHFPHGNSGCQSRPLHHCPSSGASARLAATEIPRPQQAPMLPRHPVAVGP